MRAHDRFKAEVELYPAVLKLFAGCRRVFGEVPYENKRVDLVFSSLQFRYLWAVELKLCKWRVALKQAALNQVFANLSYVALPVYIVERLSESDLAIFSRYSVGLLSVSRSDASVVLEASPTEFLRTEFYEKVKSTLSDVAANSIRSERKVAWCMQRQPIPQSLSDLITRMDQILT